jgi:ADP-heptose:LPS heptosyltransferase
LALRLIDEGVQIVVVGGREDVGSGEAITAGNRGLSLAGKTSLAETAGVIQQSRLVVSGDSGVLHVAVGLDVPTVSLFGPGIAAKWAPRGENHTVINKQLSCSPCTRFGYTPHCTIGACCISDISVDEVFDAAQKQLSRITREG